MASASPARRWRSSSPAATEALGAHLGRNADAGDVLALMGDLGSGKTCFVRGLARGLEVAEPVASPTFTLMNTYAGRLELYHFDAWRADAERAYLMDGGEEWLTGEGVAVVEWSERVTDLLPAERLVLRLGHLAPTERSIELEVLGSGARTEIWRRVLGEPFERRIDGLSAAD